MSFRTSRLVGVGAVSVDLVVCLSTGLRAPHRKRFLWCRSALSSPARLPRSRHCPARLRGFWNGGTDLRSARGDALSAFLLLKAYYGRLYHSSADLVIASC